MDMGPGIGKWVLAVDMVVLGLDMVVLVLDMGPGCGYGGPGFGYGSWLWIWVLPLETSRQMTVFTLIELFVDQSHQRNAVWFSVQEVHVHPPPK